MLFYITVSLHEDLKATFSSFGTVTYAHVVYEKETKRSKDPML